MQIAMDFPLTDFEQATLEQLISYKCKDEQDIEKLLTDSRNINEAISKAREWNNKRIELGLPIFT